MYSQIYSDLFSGKGKNIIHPTILRNYVWLIEKGTISTGDHWQGIEIDKSNPIVSIYNLNDDFDLTEIDPVNDLQPSIPWAEDHFLERVAGDPVNPGEQYKNWPYYTSRSFNNDSAFRSKDQFDHNYMERYWCKGYKGIRFDYGDLNDIIGRLKKDNGTRQAFLSVWHPEDQSNEGQRVPCTIGYWFYKDQFGMLSCTYLIRSCDAIRHYRNDLYMTMRLLQWVAEKTGMNPGKLFTWIGSFHCFKSDLYTLRKIINKGTL